MAITNKKDLLIDYCLRRLGAPVIQINVDEEQVLDRVDDAIQRFHYYHQDAIERQMLVLTISQNDIDNKYFTVDSNVQEVLSFILPDSFSGSASAFANLSVNGVSLGDIFSNPLGGLGDFYMSQQRISLMSSLLGKSHTQFEFNQHTHKLKIFTDWTKFEAGVSKMAIECYTKIDPEVEKELYNDPWLKEYTTALIKKQWGTNLKKLKGVVLPGGVELNGGEIYDEAVEEIKDLEQRMLEEISDPVDMFVM